MAERNERPERPMRGGRKGHRKVCQFCVDKIDYIDYKDVARLRRCMSERAKILPRRVTGTCARHQRAGYERAWPRDFGSRLPYLTHSISHRTNIRTERAY